MVKESPLKPTCGVSVDRQKVAGAATGGNPLQSPVFHALPVTHCVTDLDHSPAASQVAILCNLQLFMLAYL